MNFSAAELAALEAGSQRIGIFFRLETDPPVRLWFGFGQIRPGINALDGAGETYLGAGELGALPSLKQLINGAAERVEFSLSGVSGRAMEIASGGDQRQVKGKRVSIGFCLFAADWSQIGPVRWCANYVADFLSIAQDISDADRSITRRIVLSCGSRLTGRRRPHYAYWTDADQQKRVPGDRFCERVQLYANGFSKTWPRVYT